MRALRLLLVAGTTLLACTPAAGQQIVRSAGPQSVAVTVYRAPYRGAAEPMNLQWLNGYALISETRRVTIPAGESDLRFEGVAGGILPQSAIVTGLPGGVVEKNQDAWLLSPASLIDAALGKRVHLRRTSRATGAVRETDAVVRSGPDGAVVIETPDGVEALRCSGLPETLRYDGVPPRLSAKPTLSVRVRSPRTVTANVTLSYLASDFDWQANYVAELSADGRRMDLFAWLTLANADETSFVKADTQAVAGRLNRRAVRAGRPRAAPLTLRCWPMGTTTSDLSEVQAEREEEIMVTGSRIPAPMAMMAPPAPPPPPPPPSPVMAEQEDLGDLKLYRIPLPVTVAAKSQKQVALLSRKAVKVETVYRRRIYATSPGQGAGQGVMRVVKTRNMVSEGLGLPLPSGGVAIFAGGQARPLLLGRGSLEDKAVGEDVEIVIGLASTVGLEVVNHSPPGQQSGDWEIIASNARNETVELEIEIEASGAKLVSETEIGTRDGRPLWAVTVPANGRVSLRYKVETPARATPITGS